MSHGILVIDKPLGPTSHDVVATIRRRFRTRAVGHAGTLDPAASGVLVILLGHATRLAPYLTAADKSYLAEVHLGVLTDSLDAQGTVVHVAPIPLLCGVGLADGVNSRMLQDALIAERSRTSQVPPNTSAIHIGGERAHAKARRGEAFTLSARAVEVRSIEFVTSSVEPPIVQVKMTTSKGYYVRAFARDFAERLGTVGHIRALRRVASGAFDISQAVALDAAELSLIPIARAIKLALPHCTLSDSEAADARVGKPLYSGPALATAGPCAWFAGDGSLVAIGEATQAGLLMASTPPCARVLRGFPALEP
jgi:tRNA pseudouridine55 synthase